MKKAILFEPKLLARVKQNSPDLYEFYSNSPLEKYDFADYGTGNYHMYINQEVLELLEPLKKNECLNIDDIILCFQAGYILGRQDLVGKFAGKNTDPIKCANIISVVINMVVSYPYYTIETLLNAKNFDNRNGIVFSKLTYQEAQYIVAWETIFSRHEEFNSLFVRINDNLKSEDPDNKATWGYPEFN